MPSLASGRSCCTAWAMTWAVECRRTFRPSGESMVTPSTSAPSGSSWSRSFSSPLTRATTTSRRSKKSSAPVVPVVTLVSSPSTRRVICWASDTGVSYSKLRLHSLWHTGTTASHRQCYRFRYGPTNAAHGGAEPRLPVEPGNRQRPADAIEGRWHIAEGLRAGHPGGPADGLRQGQTVRFAQVPGHARADADAPGTGPSGGPADQQQAGSKQKRTGVFLGLVEEDRIHA